MNQLDVFGDTCKLIEHHVKYKEIHGYDKTVWITPSEHRKLHIRLRNEGKCNVTVDDLNKISMCAHQRTDKAKKYVQSKYYKKLGQEYKLKNTERIDFSEALITNVEFRESIIYNHKTGSIGYTAGFVARPGHKLPIINIDGVQSSIQAVNAAKSARFKRV